MVEPIVLGDVPGGTSLVLLPDAARLPRVAWWGPVTDGLDALDVAAAIGTAGVPSSAQGVTGRSVSLLPGVDEHWPGRPGLAGHRLGADAAGYDWTPSFTPRSIEADGGDIRVDSIDLDAALELTTELEATAGGPIRVRHTITNRGASPYLVDALDVVVPVPDRAGELLDFTGRWGAERSPQRRPITDGTWLREGRTGRTGHDAATQLLAGAPGFGFGDGEVWAVHVAWSGNSRHYLERQASGLITLGGGEVLLPGEIVLGDGESYSSPWVFFAASTAGMDAVASQFHRYLRSLPSHPRRPRPVIANVWEAVYFDHDLDRLRELADLAAGVGVERVVLDDGWFGARRDDTAGLGDWTVSDVAWPDGLTPFVDHLRSLGLEYGLWFEPEMVNPDSNLFREHPDWILGSPHRTPREVRHQLVLDLGRPEVGDYLFEQLDAVLAAYPIAFVKWDHNRELPDASDRDGRPGAHAQTVGFYRLLDRLRAAHPDVEWESCASGGGRIDLGVLERVERVWTSDTTDPLSRQGIQRWTGQLVPPEYLGAHVSAPRNHQTGRVTSLDFRVATAFFGDLGVEWDLAAATPAERERLAAWIELYKLHRSLLHSGEVCRVDTGENAVWVHGVRASDRRRAVMAYVQLDEFVPDPPPFRVPGLDVHRRYRCEVIAPPSDQTCEPFDGLVLGGATLASVGVPAPHRAPLSAVLVSITALD